MTAATKAFKTLTDQQLVEILALARDSDSVRIDLTGEQRTKTKAALESLSRELADARA